MSSSSPGGFTGIQERTKGFADRVPVIIDDGHWVKDSWEIAEYLDAKSPDRPMLFEGDSMKVLTKFIDQLAVGDRDPPVVLVLHPRLSRLVPAAGPRLCPREP